MTMISVVRLTGTPRERGEQHGEALRPMIREGLDRWRARLAEHRNADVDGYLARFVRETGFASAMQTHTPGLVAEIAGMAYGADAAYDEVFAYCMVDEEWWF